MGGENRNDIFFVADFWAVCPDVFENTFLS
jgi:hypothetical protein